MTDRDPVSFIFGDFILIPERQQLRFRSEVVRLGSRALALLTALVEQPGKLVTKRELFDRAWPDTFVEEGNLKVNMASLRRALQNHVGAAQYIATVVGRGYRFIAPVKRGGGHSVPLTSAAPTRLPATSVRAVGRETEVTAVLQAVSISRLTSIVGAGGVGKTTVALAVVKQVEAAFDDMVALADLSTATIISEVPSVIAAAIGLPPTIGDPIEAICEYVGERDFLLMLDGCEPFIESVAWTADRLLADMPNLKILATSREPLRVHEERIYRLGPLEYPPASPSLTMEMAMAYPSVRLFVERVTNFSRCFEVECADAISIARICRQLDGLPLAIEIAATWMDAFGLERLSVLHPERFRQLTGLRAKQPRHRTLASTIDWSYGLLSESEQRLLRCLATFPGAFTFEDAIERGLAGNTDATAIVCDLAGLVAKSMIVADTHEVGTSYRMLTTTRSYVLERLAETEESDDLTGDLFHREEPAGAACAWFAPTTHAGRRSQLAVATK